MKWHFPVGLLYDLYSGVSDQLQDDNGNGGRKGHHVYGLEEQKLRDQLRTWKLTLHFENWPSESLAKLDEDGKFMRDAFTNSVKEASFMRHGSGKVVMALSKEDSTQLWDSVEKREFYRTVRQRGLISGKTIFHVSTLSARSSFTLQGPIYVISPQRYTCQQQRIPQTVQIH